MPIQKRGTRMISPSAPNRDDWFPTKVYSAKSRPLAGLIFQVICCPEALAAVTRSDAENLKPFTCRTSDSLPSCMPASILDFPSSTAIMAISCGCLVPVGTEMTLTEDVVG